MARCSRCICRLLRRLAPSQLQLRPQLAIFAPQRYQLALL